jgi:hypothetical protein
MVCQCCTWLYIAQSACAYCLQHKLDGCRHASWHLWQHALVRQQHPRDVGCECLKTLHASNNHAAGLPEADYAYVEQLLTAMKEGKPAPTRQEAAKAAAAVAPAAAVSGMAPKMW